MFPECKQKYWPNLVSEEEAYIDSTAGAQFSAELIMALKGLLY